jgi:hypothetical protein
MAMRGKNDDESGSVDYATHERDGARIDSKKSRENSGLGGSVTTRIARGTSREASDGCGEVQTKSEPVQRNLTWPFKANKSGVSVTTARGNYLIPWKNAGNPFTQNGAPRALKKLQPPAQLSSEFNFCEPFPYKSMT